MALLFGLTFHHHTWKLLKNCIENIYDLVPLPIDSLPGTTLNIFQTMYYITPYKFF